MAEVAGSNSRSHPKLFSTQLLKANSNKLLFPCPRLPEMGLHKRNRFQNTPSCCWFRPTAMFIAYQTGTGSDDVHVSLWNTLGLCSTAKGRHLHILCVGVPGLSAAVAGSPGNESFEVALPRPPLYHQLCKEDQQGFKIPKLLILGHKPE